MNFLDIEITQNLYIKIFVVLLISIVIYLAFTMSSLLIFKSYTLGANTSVNDDEINTHIDILEKSGKKIEIAGWAYKEGDKITNVKSNYVLKNQETGKMYLMRTKMEENINLSDPNLKLAGIHAQCLLIGLPSGRYDICVLYQNAEEDILANTSIYVDL